MSLLNEFRFQGSEQYEYDNKEEAEQKALELSKKYHFITSQVIHTNKTYTACNYHSSLAYPNIVVSLFRDGKHIEQV